MSDHRFAILITGIFPDIKSWNHLLPGDKVAIDIIPFIHINPVDDPLILERISELSRLPVHAIFTSSEAVRMLKSLVSAPVSWTVWSTSGNTQTLLRDWLGNEAAITSAPDAASLAELLIATPVGEAVFFCGTQRLDVLPGRLNSYGAEVEEIHLYDTTATPQKLRKDFDAILFFSPSAVDSFFSMNRIPEQTTVFALGNTTAEALKRRISNPVNIAEQPDKILLLQKAIEYAHAHPIL